METLSGYEVVRSAPPGEARAAAKDKVGPDQLIVRFSQFGNWYRIASWFEGEFMERVERGAFAKTIKEQGDRVRVLFDHGFDPSIGEKVLGSITDLREDSDAAVLEADLFDTSYNADLIPGLRAGVYGSSMRFVVMKDEWEDTPEPSEFNPRGIPQRTIKEAKLIEAGPVTFGANPESTSAMRSSTDEFYERLKMRDPQRVEAIARSLQSRTPPAPEAAREGTSSEAGAATTATEPPHGTPGLTPSQRRERLYPILTKKEK